MNRIRKPVFLLLALALLFTAARGEGWCLSEDNYALLTTLVEQLQSACDNPPGADREDVLDTLKAIRKNRADDFDVAAKVVKHWYGTVLNSSYPMYIHRGEEEAETLDRSYPDFSEKHAFVVLGYQLQDGEMTGELRGRCEAAAAAYRSFPESFLICTGGATGPNNPYSHTEAEKMKEYLTEECGIDEWRIFTETEALSTVDNAVNTFRILRERNFGSYTLVTSDYHQLWSQVLFNAVGAVYEKGAGYTARLVANYNFPARQGASYTAGCRGALSQVKPLFKKGIGTGL